MDETQTVGFEIGEERYEIPDFGSLTLDEAEIMYDISGVIQEQLAPLHPESSDDEKLAHELQSIRLIGNPRFKRALAHIAYRRRHPDADFDHISFVVGGANAMDVTLEFLRGDPDPPAQSSPKQLASKRSTSDPSSSGDSGTASGSDSSAQVVPLSPTGTGG